MPYKAVINKLPGESEAAFEALREYAVELKPPRAVSQLDKRSDYNIKTLYKWHAEHHWRARVQEFDDTVRANQEETVVKVACDVARIHANTVRNLALIHEKRSEQYLDMESLSEVDYSTLYKAVAANIKDQQALTGSAEEGTESAQDGIDWSALSNDEAAEAMRLKDKFDKITGKAKKS